ncbi:hypothetical protein PAXINDRAFT_95903 [Paxillus involutus ATCC 200175]|nr:hypothetical protein PAXINDRAFT_95903 [Paxillus involutus ATCC 200175]
MPRGIPNPKKDDFGMRYTSMHVPLAPNPKHMGTSYLKTESQTLWARNATRKQKIPAEDVPAPSDQRRGSQVVVIHPGSRYLRIGKASDVTPLSVPNVIARKHKPPIPEPTFVESITRPRKGRDVHSSTPHPPNGDEYAVSPPSDDDPFEVKLASIIVSLRERMRFYKLRVTPHATSIASTFNERFKPEIIPEYNDPFQVEWIHEPLSDNTCLIGEEALQISDPQALGYTVRWPINGHNFNSRDYPSTQMILDDIETIISTVLEEKLNIKRREFKNFSVMLVIPDFYDRVYVREFINLLLVSLGFKQICVQQESLATTYGAGISNACVVDIGAVISSIACVDEGLVIADSRMSLNMGGDDITEFLYVLLERISFPYRDINLARWHDWLVMEDLKSRLCTLAEVLGLTGLLRISVKSRSTSMISIGTSFVPVSVGSATGGGGLGSAEGNDTSCCSTFAPFSVALPGLATTPDKTPQANLPSQPAAQVPPQPAPPASNFLGGLSIDVCFEASKLPLDVAIFNSARACGGDEKIRKYLQAVLVIGGGAQIPGMAHALESRLQAIATPLVPNMDKVQIIPPPKDVDPKFLAWKGAAVLGKMDSVADLWLTPADWDLLGMRGLKERCFYL